VVEPGSDRRVTYDDQRLAERKVREEGGQIEPREQSVDSPAYRHRLWSVIDNPILYYLTHAESARVRRQETIATFFRDDG
jgi:hypothetical protein